MAPQSEPLQPNFYEQVYQIVTLIPKGRVTTYGAIAKALGVAKSSRMVGTALINVHHPNINLPIHRVVNRNGLLTGKHHYQHPTHILAVEVFFKDVFEIEEEQIIRTKNHPSAS